MCSRSLDPIDVVAKLRGAFDHTFTAPAREHSTDVEDLLAVRISGRAYLVRVRDSAGLVAVEKVVPLPSRDPAMLGLAGIGGAVVPVFDTATFLGDEGVGEAPRWLVLRRLPDGLIAFAVAHVDGHVRLPSSDIARARGGGGERETHATEIARMGEASVAVIDLSSIAQALSARASRGSGEER